MMMKKINNMVLNKFLKKEKNWIDPKDMNQL